MGHDVESDELGSSRLGENAEVYPHRSLAFP